MLDLIIPDLHRIWGGLKCHDQPPFLANLFMTSALIKVALLVALVLLFLKKMHPQPPLVIARLKGVCSNVNSSFKYVFKRKRNKPLAIMPYFEQNS